MARRKQARGDCAYCGKAYSRGGLTKHLKTCKARQEVIEQANRKRMATQPLFHLVIQDGLGRDFFLHLEINGRATLDDLDMYLRHIWLECCGHLSQFQIGEVRFTQIFDDGFSIGDEQAMDVPVAQLFEPGMEIPYEYDFGTTSELLVRVLDVREGQPTTSHPVALMARNQLEMPDCQICGKPATWIMSDGWMIQGIHGIYCDKHIENVAEKGEGEGVYPFRIYNAPRMGMCGYDGPAEPPY